MIQVTKEIIDKLVEHDYKFTYTYPYPEPVTPKISEVLKWLREEKTISVEPYASASGWRVTICRAYHQDRCDAGGGTCLKEEVIGYNDGGAFEKY